MLTCSRELFRGYTPLSFHTHVSDVTPLTMASLLLHLANASSSTSPLSAVNRGGALYSLGWTETHLRTPRLAVMLGSYGAAYGPQVSSVR